MKKIKNLGWLFITLLLIACQPNATKVENKNGEVRINDPHSYSNPFESVQQHLQLDIQLDFESKTIKGLASWNIKNSDSAKQIIFDIQHLNILHVTLDSLSDKTKFTIRKGEPFLGDALIIPIQPHTRSVQIYYETTDSSTGLQWLTPEQTHDKKFPFLFTQSQAILARSWIPIQDSPGIRFTYNAKVKVPNGYMALMSARNPTSINNEGTYQFEQPYPIPSYLMALSAGVINFQSIGKRTGVYAEPGMMKSVSYELAEMEMMLEKTEKLFGPYAWERYDVLVLPPSFPFGGMENPMLTFATPTIIAGDRSLTSLIAHELAHSWSGNLTTNATWNDFWLNEGFTVYLERRIMEEMYGKDYADMLNVLGYGDLKLTLEDMISSGNEKDTRLKLELGNRNPDDGMNDIAYEKGYALLVTLENIVGRKRWDAFLKNYFKSHAFQSLTTEMFIDEVYQHLFDKGSAQDHKIQLNEWIYEPGLPQSYAEPLSHRFRYCDSLATKFVTSGEIKNEEVKKWTSHEWQYFLRKIKAEVTVAQMKILDQQFNLTSTGNSEILALWLEASIIHQYEKAYPVLNNFLGSVGRRKFLLPLYKTMLKYPHSKLMAKEMYAKYRNTYHSVSMSSLDEIVLGKSN